MTQVTHTSLLRPKPRGKKFSNALVLFAVYIHRPVGGGFQGFEPPLEVNDGGLKTQTFDFQLLANSGGMENKL